VTRPTPTARSDIPGFSNTGAPEDEGQHLQNAYRTARQHGGPGRFGFDPAAHLTESSPLATRGAAERLFREWRPHWDLDKPWLLEKSPPNLVRTRFLQALFPGARFVVLMRHPAAVALATVKMAAGTPVPRLIEHWLACHERFEADRPHLEYALVVRYESFIAEPDALLLQVYDFLGVAPCRLQQDIDPHGNRRYLERWNAFLRDGCRPDCPFPACRRLGRARAARTPGTGKTKAASNPWDRGGRELRGADTPLLERACRAAAPRTRRPRGPPPQ